MIVKADHNLPEIAAPAGDTDMLVASVRAGADAVYLGLKQFSARASAKNFSNEDLRHAVGYCHARGVRIFVAINTLIYNEELPSLVESIKQLAEYGVDAVIVQDMAVFRLVKNICPELKVHASTQCGALTANAVRYLGDLGFDRVVIGREAGINEISRAVKTGVDIETFVHGALCYSVSGSCYMSAFLGGRSANRGRCASPCRLPYGVAGQRPQSILSLKDLCNLDRLTELKKLGVASVKIEGRMRTPEYAAAAVDATVKGRDGLQFDRDTLMSAFSHGGFTNGYYHGMPDDEIFGARTERDGAITRAALPSLRSIYRTERQSVPVDITLTLSDDMMTIKMFCEGDMVEEHRKVATEYTEKDQVEPLKKALGKLGGTPFYAKEVTVDVPDNVFIPSSEVSSLRRTVAEMLLSVREKIAPLAMADYELVPEQRQKKSDKKRLRVRVANLEQLSLILENRQHDVEYFIIPAELVEQTAEKYIDRCIVEYPRGCGDEKLAELYNHAEALGFTRHMADNLSQLAIFGDGATIHGGFGLNITNRIAAEFYLSQNISDIVLSVELSAASTGEFNATTGVIGYGHFPMMLSAALPKLGDETEIIDRKSKRIKAVKRQNFIELYNPVPLYIADRQREFDVDFFLLYFTDETPERVSEIVDMFTAVDAVMPNFDYTRGLYY